MIKIVEAKVIILSDPESSLLVVPTHFILPFQIKGRKMGSCSVDFFCYRLV